jgi:hypothetical protein
MAVLQAVRAQTLGLPHDAALSWGLNRAIFYAAAKRGFQEAPATSPEEGAQPAPAPAPDRYRLGDDEAYRDPTSKELVFTIGGQVQTVEKFEQQVSKRFGTEQNFRAAWDEATGIVGAFDRAVLASPRRFYAEVYKPRRDDLSDSWTQRYSPLPKKR